MQYPLNYFIALEDHPLLTLGGFTELLLRTPKKRVGSITLDELCSISAYPHGLYVLFDENNSPCYIGKATSRSFIERIPSHFDPREDAWFNTIPKRVKKYHEVSLYQDALQQGLSLHIMLIGIKDTPKTSRLERVLRSFLKPRFNAGKYEYFAHDTLEKLLLI